MRERNFSWRNERGATIALVAVSLTAVLAMGALAVDMGMLLKARGDAQRAADAAALAGASAFLGAKPHDAVDDARDRAFEYAARNYVGATYIDTSAKATSVTGTRSVTTSNEAVVVVIPDSEKVRVIIRRPSIGTFFSRIFGVDVVPVAAKAAAIAASAGNGKCVKPFAMPDIWQENNVGSQGEDKNSNRIPESITNPTEKWEYNSEAGSQGNRTWPADHYRPYNDTKPGRTGVETGWGTSYRNDSESGGLKYWDDFGRQLVIKPNNPQAAPAPGFFQAWVLPGSGRGAQEYKRNIETCNPVEVALEQDYDVDEEIITQDNEPGNMLGPTKQGIENLIAQDSLACWAEFDHPQRPGYKTGEVRKRATPGGPCSVAYPGWEGSPRVMLTPLFDPSLITTGRTPLTFNNLAVWFLEGQGNGNQAPIIARFMYFAKGTSSDTTTGSLIKKLRLVE